MSQDVSTASENPRLRIFVSSPGDVAEERLIAKRILDRLAAEFAPVARLESIFWEHEPLLASESFQEQIPLPSQTDVVICILWSRLGTRLPQEFQNPDGTPRYKTGTEFEFDDALEGRKQHGKPDLLVYRKTAEPLVSLKDTAAAAQALEQKVLLDRFVEHFFHGDGGTLIAAFQPFDNAADFETRLEEHLRKLVVGRLQKLGIDLEHRAEIAAPTWTQGSPFRGLAVFEYEHHAIFFGRTRAIGEVIERLKRQAADGRAFLLVLGVSGCGKSSLVRAGVLPMLVQPAVVEGVGLWRRAILRPAERTTGGTGDLFDALAAALLAKDALPELTSDGTTAEKLAADLRAKPDAAHLLLRGYLAKAAGALPKAKDSPVEPAARLVLVIDQLEELFTTNEFSAENRVAFFDAVRSLAESGQTWVIATLRSDFYHRCAAIPALVKLKSVGGQYDLAPPDVSEIAQLVRRPAYAAGLRFEEDLETGDRLDDLLRDATAANRESLPLLEFTLDELYRRRSGNALTLAAYRELGGIEGALAKRADEAFGGLPDVGRLALPRVFRELVTVGDGEADRPTRKQASLDSFGQADGASPARQLVDQFIRERLLTAKEGKGSEVKGAAVVEVAHEALLSRWQPLVDWLKQDRELLRVRGRISSASARWNEEGRKTDRLLQSGKPLEEANQLVSAAFDLAPLESAYIEASRKQDRRRRTLKRSAIAALALLTLLTSIAAVVANHLRKTADEATAEMTRQKNAANVAEKNALDAEELEAHQKKEALEAEKAAENAKNDADKAKADTLEAYKKERRQLALSYLERASGELERGDRQLGFAILSEAYVFTNDQPDLESTLCELFGAWNYSLPIPPLPHGGWVSSVAFSPDGTKIATASEDKTARIWDAATGRPLGPPIKHDDMVWSVAFTPDGSKILTGCLKAQLWDVATGQPAGQPIEHQGGGGVLSVAISRDGTKFATGGNGLASARVWDAQSGKEIGDALITNDPVYSLAFSPDGKKLATASGRENAGDARIWDIETGKQLASMHHDDEVHAVAFSPDGAKVLTGSFDKTARLWDAATGVQISEFKHPDSVYAVAFSSDGAKILTGCGDKTAKLWDIASGKQLPLDVKHDDAVTSVAFNPMRSEIATGSIDKTARLWDISAKPSGHLLAHKDVVRSVAFSPDGMAILTGSYDGTARIWDPSTGRPIDEPLKHDGRVVGVAFEADAPNAADKRATDSDKPLNQWACGDYQLNVLHVKEAHVRLMTAMVDSQPRDSGLGFHIQPGGDRNTFAFSLDGSRFIAAGTDGATIWDTITGKSVGQISSGVDYSAQGEQRQKSFSAVALSGDGKKVITATGPNGAVQDANGKLLGPMFTNDDDIVALALSPDEKHIVTSSAGRTARIWDTKTGQSVGEPLRHGDRINVVAFSPDSAKVVTGSKDSTARLWDVASAKPLGPPMQHDSEVRSVAFSPDGKRLVVGCADGSVCMWTVPQAWPNDFRFVTAYALLRSGYELRPDTGLHQLTPSEADDEWQKVLTSGVQLPEPPAQPITFGQAETPKTTDGALTLVAWNLGFQLNFAALLAADGAKLDDAKNIYETAKKLAAIIDVEIPKLPDKSDLTTTMKYVGEMDEALKGKIKEKQGDKAANLFALSATATDVLPLYAPENTEINNQLAGRLTDLAKAAELPDRFWQPVVKVMHDKGTSEALRDAVLKMDDDVSDYLKTQLKQPPSQ